jgi:hypothetical protein
MDHGAGRDVGVESIHEADVFLPKKDVHVGTELAGFVAQIEADARMLVFEGVDDLAHCPARGMDLSLIPGALTKSNRDAYCDADVVWILHVVPRGSEVSSRA